MQPRPSRWVRLAWVSSQRGNASHFHENNGRIPACAKSVSEHRLQEIVATACTGNSARRTCYSAVDGFMTNHHRPTSRGSAPAPPTARHCTSRSHGGSPRRLATPAAAAAAAERPRPAPRRRHSGSSARLRPMTTSRSAAAPAEMPSCHRSSQMAVQVAAAVRLGKPLEQQAGNGSRLRRRPMRRMMTAARRAGRRLCTRHRRHAAAQQVHLCPRACMLLDQLAQGRNHSVRQPLSGDGFPGRHEPFPAGRCRKCCSLTEN